MIRLLAICGRIFLRMLSEAILANDNGAGLRV
jgi:hypothetical protein